MNGDCFLAWVSHFQEFPPICISFQGCLHCFPSRIHPGYPLDLASCVTFKHATGPILDEAKGSYVSLACGRGWVGPLIQDSLPTLDTRGDSSGQLHKGKPNRGMHKPGRGRTVLLTPRSPLNRPPPGASLDTKTTFKICNEASCLKPNKCLCVPNDVM